MDLIPRVGSWAHKVTVETTYMEVLLSETRLSLKKQNLFFKMFVSFLLLQLCFKLDVSPNITTKDNVVYSCYMLQCR